MSYLNEYDKLVPSSVGNKLQIVPSREKSNLKNATGAKDCGSPGEPSLLDGHMVNYGRMKSQASVLLFAHLMHFFYLLNVRVYFLTSALKYISYVS